MIKNDNNKEIKIVQEIKLDNIKNLIRCAFLVGQQKGLDGLRYEHPVAREEREFLVNILTSKHIL